MELAEMVEKIAAAPGWSKKRLAQELNVDYMTVYRWSGGDIKQARYNHAQQLAEIWDRLVHEGRLDGAENREADEREYSVGEGETVDVPAGNQSIRIINYGMVRIVVEKREKEHPEDA